MLNCQLNWESISYNNNNSIYSHSQHTYQYIWNGGSDDIRFYWCETHIIGIATPHCACMHVSYFWQGLQCCNPGTACCNVTRLSTGLQLSVYWLHVRCVVNLSTLKRVRTYIPPFQLYCWMPSLRRWISHLIASNQQSGYSERNTTLNSSIRIHVS